LGTSGSRQSGPQFALSQTHASSSGSNDVRKKPGDSLTLEVNQVASVILSRYSERLRRVIAVSDAAAREAKMPGGFQHVTVACPDL
jgi:hypothetical protein